MIEINLISKKFGLEIFKNFSYRFSNNNIYFLNGPNGSGKSTLLKLIKGIYICDSGEINFDNNLNNKDHVVYIDSNSRSFFHRLTVQQNLEYFYALHNRNDNLKTLKELLYLFDINSLLHKKFSSLSQGQMQIISIIRGLSSKPNIILLDEVFSSLDDRNKEIVFKYITSFIRKEKALVVFTSHGDNYNELVYKELCLS